MISYNQLKYFREITEQQGFTRAAEKLYVSQSTLSKSMRALEAEFQIEIIDRKSKTFALTEEGRLVYEYACRVIDHMNAQTEELYQKLRGVGGTISIGLPPTAGPAYFNSRIYEYRKQNPNIKVEMHETPSKRIRALMADGKIDIGIVLEPFYDENYNVVRVYESEIVICVSVKHRLAKRKSIRLEELADDSFLMLSPDYMFRDIVADYCRQAGFEPNVSFESSQWDVIYDMAADNFGVAFFPRWLMEKRKDARTRILKVSEPRMPWYLSLCYKKNRYLTTPMKKFLETCAPLHE